MSTMNPVTYAKSTAAMDISALANKHQVIARIERERSIDGRAFAVEPGEVMRQYVDLSVGQFRWVNHYHNGLLFQVACTPDEAERYTVALRLDGDTLPVVVAD